MIKYPEKEITLQDVRQKAIKLLARREHTRLELQQKLLQRGYPLDLIKSASEKLIQQDLLNEERFVENYIRFRSNKGYGPIRIALELKQRGITNDLMNNYLDNTAEVWLNVARKVHDKRFGKRMPKNFAEQAQQMRFLQQRGFAKEHIDWLFQQED